MRKVLALMVASLLLLGTLGCGQDPTTKPGFKKENINPSNVKMGSVPVKTPGVENAPPAAKAPVEEKK